ncbi:MAG: hypothetical protein E7004_06360 [Alphaproteobacteria bacterium]|nr:hypothetical protein [Alphaproteobacteria bacterium]
MKVIYEFDLDKEDNKELFLFQNANNMLMIISDIYDQLKEWYHHDSRGSIPTDEVHDRILQIMNENINVERLIF